MSKALKIFIVLNLLLSAGVAYLGFTAFSERTLLKAEALELENTLHQISANLKWGEPVAWEEPGDEQQISFQIPVPVKGAELSNLESRINELSKYSNTRLTQLEQRNIQLNDTREVLADTRDELADRDRDLKLTLQQKDELTTELAGTNRKLSEARTQVSTLQTDKAGKEQAIDDKNDTVTDLNNSIASLEIDIETREDELEKAKTDFERCISGAEGKSKRSKEAQGKKGLVMAVNQQWEYVVIDKGDTEIEPEFEAFVHRNKEYVGKLSIVKVQDNLAIAQIVPGSLDEGEQIKPGDTLFF